MDHLNSSKLQKRKKNLERSWEKRCATNRQITNVTEKFMQNEMFQESHR